MSTTLYRTLIQIPTTLGGEIILIFTYKNNYPRFVENSTPSSPHGFQGDISGKAYVKSNMEVMMKICIICMTK